LQGRNLDVLNAFDEISIPRTALVGLGVPVLFDLVQELKFPGFAAC
jgi:hypothetical protein